MPEHQPHRLRRGRVVRAAAGPGVSQPVGAPGQVAAQVPGAVADGVAAVREAVAEWGLGVDEDELGAAVEEEEVVFGGEGEAGGGVEGEGRGRRGAGAAAGPHGGVGEEEVGVGVGEEVDGVFAGGGVEEEEGGRGVAGEEAVVVGAAAAGVDAEGVRDRDRAAGGAAEAGLG